MRKFMMPLTTAAIFLSGCTRPIENVQISRLSSVELSRIERISENELDGSTEAQRYNCAGYSVPKPPFCQFPEPPFGYGLDTTTKITWERSGFGDYTKTCAIYFVIRSPGQFEYVLITYDTVRSGGRSKRDVSSASLGVATWDRSGRPAIETVCTLPEVS